MGIKTAALEFGKEIHRYDIKQPGSELHLQIQTEMGAKLGLLTIARVERPDITTIAAQTTERSLKKILHIHDSENDDEEEMQQLAFPLQGKRFSRTFEGVGAHFIFTPESNLRFYNDADKRKYQNLYVTLTP